MVIAPMFIPRLNMDRCAFIKQAVSIPVILSDRVADPASGPCSFFHEGQEIMFDRPAPYPFSRGILMGIGRTGAASGSVQPGGCYAETCGYKGCRATRCGYVPHALALSFHGGRFQVNSLVEVCPLERHAEIYPPILSWCLSSKARRARKPLSLALAEPEQSRRREKGTDFGRQYDI